jgi:hypothetical protein
MTCPQCSTPMTFLGSAGWMRRVAYSRPCSTLPPTCYHRAQPQDGSEQRADGDHVSDVPPIDPEYPYQQGHARPPGNEGRRYGRFRAIRRVERDQNRTEDFPGWTLRQKLELLAFDARLAGVPPALLEALWEAIDQLYGLSSLSSGGDADGGSVCTAGGSEMCRMFARSWHRYLHRGSGDPPRSHRSKRPSLLRRVHQPLEARVAPERDKGWVDFEPARREIVVAHL